MKTFATLVTNIGAIATNIVLPILFALALVYFLIGVVRFIASAGDQAERSKAKVTILYGLVGLAVMVSLWSLVAIVTGTFGQSLILPTINQNTLKGNINNLNFH